MVKILEVILVITMFIAGFILGGVICSSKPKPEEKPKKKHVTDHKPKSAIVNFAIVNKETNELLAYLGGDERIVKNGVDVISFGYNEPTFLDKNGKVYVDKFHFVITSL